MKDLVKLILKSTGEQAALASTKRWIKKNSNHTSDSILKASPEEKSITFHTPLIAAVEKSYLRVMQFLETVENTANEVNAQENTALHIGIIQNKDECIIDYLVEKTDFFNINDDGYNALHVAIIKKYSLQIIEKIVNKVTPEVLNAKSKFDSTALHLAVDTDNLEVVHLLLSKGVLSNSYQLRRLSPLGAAIKRGNAAIVETLLNSDLVCPIIQGPDFDKTTDILDLWHIHQQENKSIIAPQTKKSILKALLCHGAGLHFDNVRQAFYAIYPTHRKKQIDMVFQIEIIDPSGQNKVLFVNSIASFKKYRGYINPQIIARACAHPQFAESKLAKQLIKLFAPPPCCFNEMQKFYPTSAPEISLPHVLPITLINKFTEKECSDYFNGNFLRYHQQCYILKQEIKNCLASNKPLQQNQLWHLGRLFNQNLSDYIRVMQSLRYPNSNSRDVFAEKLKKSTRELMLNQTDIVDILHKQHTHQNYECGRYLMSQAVEAFKLMFKSLKVLPKKHGEIHHALIVLYIQCLQNLGKSHLFLNNIEEGFHYSQMSLAVFRDYQSDMKARGMSNNSTALTSNYFHILHLCIFAYSLLKAHEQLYEALIEIIPLVCNNPDANPNFIADRALTAYHWAVKLGCKRSGINSHFTEALEFLKKLDSLIQHPGLTENNKSIILTLQSMKDDFGVTQYRERVMYFCEKIQSSPWFVKTTPSDTGFDFEFLPTLFNEYNRPNVDEFVKKYYPNIKIKDNTLQLNDSLFTDNSFEAFENNLSKLLKRVQITSVERPNQKTPNITTLCNELQSLQLELSKKDKQKKRGTPNPALAKRKKNTSKNSLHAAHDFKLEENWSNPIPVFTSGRKLGYRSIAITTDIQQDDRFENFKKVLFDSDGKPLNFISSIPPKGKQKQGIKFCYNEKTNQFKARIKVLGKGCKYRATGYPVQSVTDTNGDKRELFVIDSITSKKSEYRHRNS